MPTPTSTYRLQITAAFDLYAAAGSLPYLHDLGVDWVYLSPLLESEPGSDHGYDVVSHDRIDPARGGAAGLAALSAEARRLGMGVLVDVVPNHVGTATPRVNAWWWDLLSRGPASAYAAAFDVDWDAGGGRVRIPVVGDGDEAAVEVDLEGGVIRYHDDVYPLADGTTGLDEQHYELVSWRLADHELNYRRFFAVNTLAGVRVEDPEVFAASHEEIRRWFDRGLVDGLRVDHPDGLRDPAAYLADLADLTGDAYVLVEKILEPGEELAVSWACAGTTGYDVLALLDRVLIDPAGEAPLTALDARLRGRPFDWPALIHDTKRAVADGILGSEVRRVVRELPLVEGDGLRASRDPTTAADLIDAVAELAACFPVYRSYLPDGRDHLDAALTDARQRRPDLHGALDVLEPVLSDPAQPAALRFQQTTGAVMAKGVEDCAFYRTSRLASLTEVGGDPHEFALTVDAFHQAMATRQRHHPRAMTATSTHDTKRGEDVRARIAVLAELPELWEGCLRQLLTAAPLPDQGFGNLLWQSVVGAWPASRERLHAYAEKAMREAGDRTSWTEPDAAYEAPVHAAVDAAFDDPEVRHLLEALVDRVAAPGWSNAVSAKVLALTVPGVPDVYQGSELWEQSLVDPDNRRPVDLDLRRQVLSSHLAEERVSLTDSVEDAGHAKLFVTRAALRLRRDHPGLFTTYEPVATSGPAGSHLIAFDRGGALTVATRLPAGLAASGWGDTVVHLPPGRWIDVLGERTHAGDAAAGNILTELPVALLVREGGR